MAKSETFSGPIKQHKTRVRERLHIVPPGFLVFAGSEDDCGSIGCVALESFVCAHLPRKIRLLSF